MSTAREGHTRYTAAGFVRSPIRLHVDLGPRRFTAGSPLLQIYTTPLATVALTNWCPIGACDAAAYPAPNERNPVFPGVP